MATDRGGGSKVKAGKCQREQVLWGVAGAGGGGRQLVEQAAE